MEYTEAVKKVSTLKSKENYLVIEYYYDNKLVLPYKEGMILMAAFANAETLKEPYNGIHVIGAIDRSQIKATIMSDDEYKRIKIAALLNVTLDQLNDIELQAA